MLKRVFILFLFITSVMSQVSGNATKPTSLTKITPDGGVAISSVMCIEEDKHGFIWFGTNNGLFKYDTRVIKKYSHSQYKKNTLPSNRINQIFNDKHRLIVVTENGLCQYRPDYDDFIDFNIIDLKGGTIDGNFSSLTQTEDGTYWILHQNGLLSFNSNFVTNGYINVNNNTSRPRLLHLDEQGNLWVIFHNGDIYFKTPSSSEFEHFTTGIPHYTRSFYADQKNIWVGYSQNGLHCYDIDGTLIAEYNESTGFIDNSIRSILKADNGEVWVATYNGIAVFDDLKLVRVINTKHSPGLPHHSIWSMHRDSKNTIWVGTWLGGLSYYSKFNNSVTKQNQSIKDFNIDNDIITSFVQPANSKYIYISTASGQLKKYNLENDTEEVVQVGYDNTKVETIKTLAIDKNGTLWIGTYGQGIIYRKKGKQQFHRLQTPFNLGLQVISILPVDDGLWFSDYQQGTFFLPFNGGRIKRYRYNALDSTTISDNMVRKIIQDKNGDIWFATENGLNRMKKGEETFTRIHYTQKPQISSGFSFSVIENSYGDIWVGTNGGGLVKIDPKTQELTYITEVDGLPADDIYSIIEDADSNLWLATGNGICKYNIKSNEISTYKNIAGTTKSTFNANSRLMASDGRLFWGSTNGFISYKPEDVAIKNTRKPITTITNFYINNEEVLPSGDHPILKKNISITDNLILKHRHSLFSFKFVADNFINPEENKFEFRLSNFNEEWVETDFNGLAIFTNIPPGKYTFEVRASNNDGVWNDKATQISIEITPPIWKTWYAYSTYIILFSILLFIIIKEATSQRRLKEQIKLEKVKSESEENLHQMKLQFFTNISHEFRTPLTLIMGPVERLIASCSDKDSNYSQLNIIKNNSERLLRLINQILDFRKINAGKLKLKPINNDIIAFSKNIFNCFNEHARHRHFKYHFKTNHTELFTDFDPEKLDKMIFNILSNAFKFCNDYGKIEMKITGNVKDFTIAQSDNTFTLGEADADNYLEITISDTGQGISPNNMEHIFERFEQADDSKLQSSGIGLNLTKDYIQLHNGKLRVSSTLNEGSSFSILLPSKQDGILIGEVIEENSINYPTTAEQKQVKDNKIHPLPTGEKKDRALILIVEDNIELLNYLKTSLGDYFRIARAKNGVEGVQKVNSLHPDLVISDVMMPEMDGIEFCKTIKENIQTSHTPIILLTALESVSDQITGLESGADAYISKPFSFNLLMAQISNLLNIRKSLKDAFKSQSDTWENHAETMNLDKRLIIKAIKYIEDNISNSDITVDDLAESLNLSRTTLHRKLKLLTDQSATEFIRGVRLKNAAKHILSNSYKVNEVAFMVGFNSLNYFTRSFKNYYGMSPREYIKHNKQ